MIDLNSRIGLDVKINDQNKLEFGEDVDLEKMGVRSFADLAVVAADENLTSDDTPAYFMYRNVRRKGDEETISDHSQRFDLTVIPGGSLGEEFIKTSGHYHPFKPGTGIEYPELYYVASGQATYLMQKHDQNGAISDVILARVKAGEAIIMPPFYGHVTINELEETLVMANWVEGNFSSVYGDYEEKRGAAFYLYNDGGIEANPKYGEVPELKVVSVTAQAIEELKGIPIYKYVNDLSKIDLISKPEQYLEDLTIDKLFSM